MPERVFARRADTLRLQPTRSGTKLRELGTSLKCPPVYAGYKFETQIHCARMRCTDYYAALAARASNGCVGLAHGQGLLESCRHLGALKKQYSGGCVN